MHVRCDLLTAGIQCDTDHDASITASARDVVNLGDIWTWDVGVNFHTNSALGEGIPLRKHHLDRASVISTALRAGKYRLKAWGSLTSIASLYARHKSKPP